MTGRGVARSVGHGMGMNSRDLKAPNSKEIAAGIGAYLKKHGLKGWQIELKDVNNTSDLAAMMREFEADSEDKIYEVIVSEDEKF